MVYGIYASKKVECLNGRDFLIVLKDSLEALYGDRIQYVSPRINKYARCSVNGQIFSSNFNSTDSGSTVKALFALTDQSLHPYFGVVNFFFDVDTIIDFETRTCSFAYVYWFKFCTPSKESISQRYMVKKCSIQVIVLSVLVIFYLDVYFYLLVKVRAIILYVSSPNRIINMWYDIAYIVALCILI